MKKFNFLFLLLLASCNLFEGPDGLTSLIDMTDEPLGTNCDKGGIKITSGIDKNKNGLLDSSEITSTKFICNPENGDNGLSSLVNSTQEPAGANCAYGGLKIESGLDSNSNGQLDPSEIQQEKYVCNGEDGTADKEIRFRIGPFAIYAGDPSLGGPFPGIFDFDIRNYPSIDSAVFVISGVLTSDSNGQPKVLEGTFRLFDNTNVSVINNSSVVSDDFPLHTYKTSKNFINSLPKQKINLRADIIPDVGSNVFCGDSYLILIRK